MIYDINADFILYIDKLTPEPARSNPATHQRNDITPAPLFGGADAEGMQ